MSATTSTRYHWHTLVITSLASFAAGGLAISTYLNWQKRAHRRNLDLEIKQSLAAQIESDQDELQKTRHEINNKLASLQKPKESVYDEELIREQLARNYSFFGEDGMAKIRGGRVAIIGCGGVGSWAAVMLVRS